MRLVTRGRYHSHPLPAGLIRINSDGGTFSKEVTSVHKNCHHPQDLHFKILHHPLLSIGYLPQWWSRDGVWEIHFQRTWCCRVSIARYICNSTLNLIWLNIMSSQHNVHDDISGNTTTMIPMCLATTKTWTSRKRQTTVRDFNILTLSNTPVTNKGQMSDMSRTISLATTGALHIVML